MFCLLFCWRKYLGTALPLDKETAGADESVLEKKRKKQNREGAVTCPAREGRAAWHPSYICPLYFEFLFRFALLIVPPLLRGNAPAFCTGHPEFNRAASRALLGQTLISSPPPALVTSVECASFLLLLWEPSTPGKRRVWWILGFLQKSQDFHCLQEEMSPRAFYFILFCPSPWVKLSLSGVFRWQGSPSLRLNVYLHFRIRFKVPGEISVSAARRFWVASFFTGNGSSTNETR